MASLVERAYNVPEHISRISPVAFSASIFALFGVAVIVAGARLYLRIRKFGRISVDDVFLILAIIFFAASVGLMESNRDLMYLQMDVDSQLRPPPADYKVQLASFGKMDAATACMVWMAIFCVKMSFMFFFQKLIDRIRILEIWWKIVVVIIVPSALLCALLGVWICPNFSVNRTAVCTIDTIIWRESVYLDLTVAVDVLTDLLVISVPIALLWKVQSLSLMRKLALGTILCLSVFMIVCAVIRATMANVMTPYGYEMTDTVWLFFWQIMEACIGIIMVAATAFRSLYGQEKAKSSGGKYYNPDSYSSGRSEDKRRLNPTVASTSSGPGRSTVHDSGRHNRPHIRDPDEELLREVPEEMELSEKGVSHSDGHRPPIYRNDSSSPDFFV